ncbi:MULTISPECIES: ArsR/SmtB family transcription factor [Shouchella]|uniref:Winged helix-turn-helix domain-containing protein n=1 Tax=Shouchella hunanensis TaxID=766894 RepID=A0ABY7WD89_9BACI|nr:MULTISPECIES: winged helix-turn-helix domain-containing protein [Shouchella]WDF05594.1 winged helix-turn-helix domain-containing protein [Shouchella hunanensis]
MDVIHSTVRKRKTYEVVIHRSILWECALGIAAITNDRLLHTLDKPTSYWTKLRSSLSQELQDNLNLVQKNNSWKALLQLLHRKNYNDMKEFVDDLQTLSEVELKFTCLPFIGEEYQAVRELASIGDKKACSELREASAENPFFPDYITFITTGDASQLRQHLIAVLSQWYEQVIKENVEEVEQILETDYEAKVKMKEQLSPETFVQWATGGIQYKPEPQVFTVLLIPQTCYRPWNIEADLEGIKVFYYPVANASMLPADPFMLPDFLVQKYKALGDDVRMKMVKILHDRDRSLQEITELLELGKSTVHHHLKMLRSAKLVTVKESKYTLEKEAFPLMAKDLEAFLQRPV